MKILGLFILKHNNENPLFLASAYELGFVYFYQRPFLKEGLRFGVRTCVSKAKISDRISIDLADVQAVCHVWVKNDGTAYACVTDSEYPAKVAFLILREMEMTFQQKVTQQTIENIKQDTIVDYQDLEKYIKSYQDPKEADKLLKLETTLKEVTDIVHKNLQDMMARGETIEQLMGKSKDISSVSYDFYKKAKQTNQKCCSLY